MELTVLCSPFDGRKGWAHPQPATADAHSWSHIFRGSAPVAVLGSPPAHLASSGLPSASRQRAGQASESPAWLQVVGHLGTLGSPTTAASLAGLDGGAVDAGVAQAVLHRGPTTSRSVPRLSCFLECSALSCFHQVLTRKSMNLGLQVHFLALQCSGLSSAS